MPIIQFLSMSYKFYFMLKFQDENRSVNSYMFATVTQHVPLHYTVFKQKLPGNIASVWQ